MSGFLFSNIWINENYYVILQLNIKEYKVMISAEYEDLMKERWLRQRDNGEIQWGTKDGRNVPIKDMTDDHLERSINFLEKMRDQIDEFDSMGWADFHT